MDKPKILSGDVLVAKGVTKQSITLPEVGSKDVVPDGSWLEQKQIQTALDSQKHILEVERIEKIGNISHAQWRDDLQLAEVTQKTSGCWQYFGHNVGKTLYLRPEEVLFLMEVNSLLLKHNDVTVSLQKAFSLVLNSNLTYNQYRVYASLSRLGYKVYRHNKSLNGRKINPMTAPNEMVVENILKQKLSDSSMEVCGNKTSDLQSNICEQLPNTKPNNSTDIQKNQKNKTIEEGDSEKNKTVEIKESPCVMEVEETESNETNISENDHTNAQSLTERLESENTETNNGECDKVIVLDDIPMPSNRESQEELIRKHANEIIENTATSDVKACEEKSNVNSTEDDKNKNIVTAMDVNNECCCQAAADSTVETESNNNESTHTAESGIALELGPPKSLEPNNDSKKTEIGDSNKSICFSDALISNRNQMFHNYVTKLKRLTGRQYKPSDFKTLDKNFGSFPDFFRRELVLIDAPKQEYVPKNVFVNKSSYVLNLKHIRRKCTRTNSSDRSSYNSSDEANDNHVRRLRSISTTNTPENLSRPNQYQFYRPNHFWRPQNHLNYVQFNMVFQRPPFSNVYFHSRLQYQPRPNPSQRHYLYNNPNNILLPPNHRNENNNPRKRMRNDRATRLQSIKSLSMRLKQLIMNGNYHSQNIESLHRLLYAYNTRYKTNLRLTKEFDVINDDDDIVETIDLGDDGDTRNKVPRLTQDSDKFDENLNLLRKLAKKLKDLDAEKKATSTHKRALSKAIKTFNKSYDADIHMDVNFEVIDRRFINIESDSESDCVLTETQVAYKGKKLRNPFNILKRRSEQQGEPKASTSKESTNTKNYINDFTTMEATSQHQNLSRIFNGNWLPSENDFGRPEVVKKNVMNSLFLDVFKEQFLLNYVKSNVGEFDNWLEGKIAFLQHMEETDIAYQNEHKQQMSAIKESVNQSGLKPLLDPEDCSNTASVLEKLRIIKNNKELKTDTTLTIDFDAYRKEITNFKKTNPPKPHFRIIVLDESSMFPSGADVVSILSTCGDSVALVFAIVGISSVSYVQFRPIDMPVYIASNDLD
ncbi:unnamed protein product [Arctia plantaginis]|uniref:tRNA-splicing endonuclease subunit Sen54 N-terminal domain-containing protein n=1 Tax=Arctia plantaginis TaxID=874455 RepID=A0A8S0YW46_ARCPL|nr:unnamed protein product [Arctia plantaginis]